MIALSSLRVDLYDCIQLLNRIGRSPFLPKFEVNDLIQQKQPDRTEAPLTALLDLIRLDDFHFKFSILL